MASRAVEAPGQEGRRVVGGGLGLGAHVLVVCVQADVDQAVHAAAIQVSEATGEVPEAQQRVAANVGVAVARHVDAAGLGPLPVRALLRHPGHQPLELTGIVPLHGGREGPPELPLAVLHHEAAGVCSHSSSSALSSKRW